MKPVNPIEIIGGGLAGLSLGLALRREDIPVTIHEAGTYPRHRVCGEFITGLGDETIRRLGLDALLADALSLREITWFIDGRPARNQCLPLRAIAISRHRLDARLAKAFVGAGGVLRTHSRLPDPDTLPGRIIASGRRPGKSSWLGLKIHARAMASLGDLEVHLGRHCYVGLARLAGDRTNVCGLFRRQPLSAPGPDLLLLYLRAGGLHELADRLARADLDAESFCAVAAVGFDRRVPNSAGMVLGDACAMIPPFTGNGMAMAFQSAELALQPVLDYARVQTDWATACTRLRSAQRRRFGLRLAFAGLVHPFLFRPSLQRWLSALNRRGMLPLNPLYGVLH